MFPSAGASSDLMRLKVKMERRQGGSGGRECLGSDGVDKSQPVVRLHLTSASTSRCPHVLLHCIHDSPPWSSSAPPARQRPTCGQRSLIPASAWMRLFVFLISPLSLLWRLPRFYFLARSHGNTTPAAPCKKQSTQLTTAATTTTKPYHLRLNCPPQLVATVAHLTVGTPSFSGHWKHASGDGMLQLLVSVTLASHLRLIDE